MTEQEVKQWPAMPPSEMKEAVQKRFAEEYVKNRKEEKLAANHRIIISMLKNPVWGRWGEIHSYHTARLVLDKYAPDWRPKMADDRLLDAASSVGDTISDHVLVAVGIVGVVGAFFGNLMLW